MNEIPSSGGPNAKDPLRLASDQLINIADIRAIFKLGRTAAYDLTHRPGFPDPVRVSPRCYRWLASEVEGQVSAGREGERAPATGHGPANQRTPT